MSWWNDSKKGNSSIKEESAAATITEPEGRPTGKLLQGDTGDNTVGYDLTDMAKMQSTLEEVNELVAEIYEMAKNDRGGMVGSDPGATSRDAARESTIADNPGRAIVDKSRRERTIREFVSRRTYQTTGEDPARSRTGTSVRKDTTGNSTKGDCPGETSRNSAGRENTRDNDANGRNLRGVVPQDVVASDGDLDEICKLTKEIYALAKVGLEDMDETKSTAPEEETSDELAKELAYKKS